MLKSFGPVQTVLDMSLNRVNTKVSSENVILVRPKTISTGTKQLLYKTNLHHIENKGKSKLIKKLK